MIRIPFLEFFSRRHSVFIIFTFAMTFAVSCSVAEPKTNAKTADAVNSTVANSSDPAAADPAAPKGPTITIDKGGPADTVRAFYQLLREKKFKEAIFLTNLRPAIEGLTATELADFALDFEALAGQIPAQIEINGEIISGDNATVTANLPADDEGKKDTQQIKLRKSGDVWIIQTVDDEAEARIRKEGKAYFYNLRIETHEDEAKKMLERLAKAQIAYSLQHDGVCGEIQTLIDSGLLPEDIKTSASTGYNYSMKLSENKTRYFANAVPAEYGKSGRLSFLLEPDEKGFSHVTSKDLRGAPMKK
mgnify:CR=1 FL=1